MGRYIDYRDAIMIYLIKTNYLLEPDNIIISKDIIYYLRVMQQLELIYCPQSIYKAVNNKIRELQSNDLLIYSGSTKIIEGHRYRVYNINSDLLKISTQKIISI